MPTRQGAVVDLIETGVPAAVVTKQDVGGAVTVEVTDAGHAVGRRRPADMMPPLEGAVGVQLIKAGIAGGIVAEQDVRHRVAVEVPDSDHTVGRRRTAAGMPA